MTSDFRSMTAADPVLDMLLVGCGLRGLGLLTLALMHVW